MIFRKEKCGLLDDTILHPIAINPFVVTGKRHIHHYSLKIGPKGGCFEKRSSRRYGDVTGCPTTLLARRWKRWKFDDSYSYYLFSVVAYGNGGFMVCRRPRWWLWKQKRRRRVDNIFRKRCSIPPRSSSLPQVVVVPLGSLPQRHHPPMHMPPHRPIREKRFVPPWHPYPDWVLPTYFTRPCLPVIGSCDVKWSLLRHHPIRIPWRKKTTPPHPFFN